MKIQNHAKVIHYDGGSKVWKWERATGHQKSRYLINSEMAKQSVVSLLPMSCCDTYTVIVQTRFVTIENFFSSE